MYVFLKERMKYPAVCTEDQKHWILVNCTDDMVKDFAKEKNLEIGKENYYVVHHSDSAKLLSLACCCLPRRLDPVLGPNQLPAENFYSMHKFFYKNDLGDLIVKGVVLNTKGEDAPFKIASTDVKTGFKCLTDIKLNA